MTQIESYHEHLQEGLIDVTTRIDRLKTLARRVDTHEKRDVLSRLGDVMLWRDTLRARLRFARELPVAEFFLVRRELDIAWARLRRSVDALWAWCAT